MWADVGCLVSASIKECNRGASVFMPAMLATDCLTMATQVPGETFDINEQIARSRRVLPHPLNIPLPSISEVWAMINTAASASICHSKPARGEAQF